MRYLVPVVGFLLGVAVGCPSRTPIETPSEGGATGLATIPTVEPLPVAPDPHLLKPRSCPRSGHAGDRLHVSAPLPIIGLNQAHGWWWSGNGIVFLSSDRPSQSEQILLGASYGCKEGSFVYYLSESNSLYEAIVTTNELRQYPPTGELLAEDVKDYRMLRYVGPTQTRVGAAYLTNREPGKLMFGSNEILSDSCHEILASCAEYEGATFVLCRNAVGQVIDVAIGAGTHQIVDLSYADGPIDCADGHVTYRDAAGRLGHMERAGHQWSVGTGLSDQFDLGTSLQSIRMLPSPTRGFFLSTKSGTSTIGLLRRAPRGNWQSSVVVSRPGITDMDAADIYGREQSVVMFRHQHDSQSDVYVTKQITPGDITGWSTPEAAVVESFP